MKTIWKYTLQNKERQELALPKNAEILSAHAQKENICIWALVDTEQIDLVESRTILIYPTGKPFEAALTYTRSNTNTGSRFIGTVLLHNGSLVFHVFEKNKML